MISQEIKNAYEVLFNKIVDAQIHWTYAAEINKLWEKYKNLRIKFNAHFLRDSHQAHFSVVTQCLMVLYDQQKDAMGLKRFLKDLKEEISIDQSNLTNTIDVDLNTLKNFDLDGTLHALKTMRDTKYFHIDHRTATGKITRTGLVISEEKILSLVNSAVNIVLSYAALFNKDPRGFVSFDGYSHINNVLEILTPHCFDLE